MPSCLDGDIGLAKIVTGFRIEDEEAMTGTNAGSTPKKRGSGAA